MKSIKLYLPSIKFLAPDRLARLFEKPLHKSTNAYAGGGGSGASGYPPVLTTRLRRQVEGENVVRVSSTETDDSTERRTIVVGLLADKGMPTRVAKALAKELPRLGHTRLSDEVMWKVDYRSESLPLDGHGRISLRHHAEERQGLGWDIAILLTDLPLRAGTQPIVSDYSVELRVGLVSMPAIGARRIRRRTQDLVVHLLGHLLKDQLNLDESCSQIGRSLGSVRHIRAEDDQVDEHLALDGIRGRARLLAGMILDNRPWRLVPHLSGATAAAVGTAAYGVITTTFWTLADALPPWRLALINAVAIAAMVVWLLLHNHLWERPSRRREREKALLYNLSTVVTLTIGVACMYVVLYVVALLAAFAIIDGSYLSSRLGHPSGIASYATIAWLACSVGVVAGALGSSFESEEGVRKATYGKRERQRQLHGSHTGNNSDK
jgi:hypothetical protein